MDPVDIATLLMNVAVVAGSQDSPPASTTTVVVGPQMAGDSPPVSTITVQELERRIDKLSLICRAMWSIQQEKMGVTTLELNTRITELDALDGHVDGRLLKPPIKCPNCKGMICRKFNRCLFCGHVPANTDPFDTV